MVAMKFVVALEPEDVGGFDVTVPASMGLYRGGHRREGSQKC